MRWPFRVAMSTAAVMLFDQAVFAGQFLAGTFGALHTHRANATYSGIAVLIAAAAGVLIRWPGRGPLWPALACLGLFGLIALQIAVGFARMLTVHVPLGVGIIGLAAALAIWSWRPAENAERPSESPGRAAENAGRAAENAGRAAENAGQPAESAGRAA
ncbi:hypothetical protein ACPPVO_36860 [Dactylosporangium sp. McL0621]|uniref:hypothetical protein n=1 Tax=Dactylosporangium sp. McL0621 TaxID=3415678 RepID=UPI003CF5B725